MRFAYYDRLSDPEKAVYRASDAVRDVPLREPAALWPRVGALQEALAACAKEPAADELLRVQRAAQALVDGLTGMAEVEPVRVDVQAVRPKFAEGGELHGLYRWSEDDTEPPEIHLWMRTAAKARVVAFKTFLRTLLHEVLHHFDLALLGLPASFHTQGFFARESSLFHQLQTDRR